jgi:HEPN domain-containing protein
MSPLQTKELIEYWRKLAERDFETMETLFRTKHYSDSLFYSHIVLEKILKALVVKHTKQQADYTHNLLKLAQDASVDVSKENQDLLDAVNDFNMRTRYPDIKLAFYKKCTKAYTEKYLSQIKTLYKSLCLKLKEKA